VKKHETQIVIPKKINHFCFTFVLIKIHDAHCEETAKYCNHKLFLIQLLTFFVYRHVVLIIVYGLLILYP